MHVFYLHGFASSARSSKAAFFAGKLRSAGLALHTPDFNEPDFSTLTVSRMLAQTRRAIQALPPAPVVLVGSSLGGFVAVQAALAGRDSEGASPELARDASDGGRRRIDRLVLLAPALDFGGQRMRDLGDRGIDEWRRTNQLNVFHYAYGRVMPVHYELYADAQRYDSFNAQLGMPVQIFQGRRDESVDPLTVEKWAASRPYVELHMLDDDHQLMGSLDYIWREMARFLGLPAAS